MKTNMITLNNDFTKAYVSATFMKKAHVYGSREYMMLKEFRAENPDIIVAVRKSASGNTGSLSYENMERYIPISYSEMVEQLHLSEGVAFVEDAATGRIGMIAVVFDK